MVAQFCVRTLQVICANALQILPPYIIMHRNLSNFRFNGGLPTCPCSFQILSALKSHMLRKHTQPNKVNCRPAQTDAVICQVVGCEHTVHPQIFLASATI